MSDIVTTSRGNLVTVDPDIAELLQGRAVNENAGRVVVTLSLGDLILMLSGARRNEGDTVDHFNGDIFDNRLENLRYANKHTQNVNRRKPDTHGGKPTISKYRGVTRVNGEWRGQIRHHGKLHTKRCATELEAAEWYNRQALALRGEDAKLNAL